MYARGVMEGLTAQQSYLASLDSILRRHIESPGANVPAVASGILQAQILLLTGDLLLRRRDIGGIPENL